MSVRVREQTGPASAPAPAAAVHRATCAAACAFHASRSVSNSAVHQGHLFSHAHLVNRPFIHTLIRSSVHSFTRSSGHPSIHSHAPPVIRSFIHTRIRSSVHSFTQRVFDLRRKAQLKQTRGSHRLCAPKIIESRCVKRGVHERPRRQRRELVVRPTNQNAPPASTDHAVPRGAPLRRVLSSSILTNHWFIRSS